MFLKRRSLPHMQLVEGVASGGTLEKKTPSQERQEKIEKKAAAMKKEAEAERLEHQEYLKFPTIMGWYFDGTFTKDFTLFEEYAEYFNEIEEELDAQRDLIIDETITEKAYRNFWPPDYVCGGKYFRTRGVYLDLKEVREDPPKTPPNINYEKQRGVIGVQLEEGAEKEDEESSKVVVPKPSYAPAGYRDARDNWYWHEFRREYRPKDQDGDYIWCPEDKIWSEADPTFRTPYDWYFDEFLGRFLIRDKSKPENYVFDPDKNVWFKKDVKGPSLNGLRRNDYFYDENLKKWLPMTQSTGNIVFYHAGMREIVKGRRGKSGLTPDDFYYDGETGKMQEKDPKSYHEYYYDPRDKLFKKKGQPYGPGKANHYPTDYEFDVKEGLYFPKHAKECKHLEPTDWYFNRHEGKFFLKDGNNRDQYEYDPDFHVFYLKGVEGPAINELTATDYYWNENDREWKLIVSVKDPETMLDYHEAGKRRIMRGERGKSGKTPDDFYYDAIDGSFFRRDPRVFGHYWFDPEDMCWKKRGQYYGPGYFRLYPEHYYFDYDEGFYFPTTTAKLLLARLRRGELKGVSDHTPYDFCFNEMEGYFQLRNKNFPKASKYNKKTGVFHIEAPKSMNIDHNKAPKDFFYDEMTGTWLPIEHPRGFEAKYYRPAKRNNRMGPRGKAGRIPDDYFFDFEEGIFRLKEKEGDEDLYEYMPEQGVWKAIDAHDDFPNASRPTEYYFDKEEGKFVLKKNLKLGEIYLNPFTNLWYQRWRCPQDYYWDTRQLKYLRKAAARLKVDKHGVAAGGGAEGAIVGPEAVFRSPEEQKAMQVQELERRARERRDYERPWLHNFLVLAADEIRYEQELMKDRMAREGKGLSGEIQEKAGQPKQKKQVPAPGLKAKVQPRAQLQLQTKTDSRTSFVSTRDRRMSRTATATDDMDMDSVSETPVPLPPMTLPELILGPEPVGGEERVFKPVREEEYRPDPSAPPGVLRKKSSKKKKADGVSLPDDTQSEKASKKSKKKKKKGEGVSAGESEVSVASASAKSKKKKKEKSEKDKKKKK